jgi:hypothetical protein
VNWKSNGIIGNRTRDHLACSIVPQPTTLPRAPSLAIIGRIVQAPDVGWVLRIGRGNWSTRRKSAPVLLYPPQIPRDLTWDRTRAPTMGSRRLTAWVMTRPIQTYWLVIQHNCPRIILNWILRIQAHWQHTIPLLDLLTLSVMGLVATSEVFAKIHNLWITELLNLFLIVIKLDVAICFF